MWRWRRRFEDARYERRARGPRLLNYRGSGGGCAVCSWRVCRRVVVISVFARRWLLRGLVADEANVDTRLLNTLENILNCSVESAMR